MKKLPRKIPIQRQKKLFQMLAENAERTTKSNNPERSGGITMSMATFQISATQAARDFAGVQLGFICSFAACCNSTQNRWI